MAREFRYRDGIAVAQIIVFTCFLFVGIIIGLQKKIGWFGLMTISIIRLVGASCMLATIQNSSQSVWAAVFVCESLGLIILTYLLLGQLTRVYVSIVTVFLYCSSCASCFPKLFSRGHFFELNLNG